MKKIFVGILGVATATVLMGSGGFPHQGAGGGGGSTPVYGSAYSSSPLSAETGWSDPMPLGTTFFESSAGVHDATLYASGTATGTQTSTTLQDTGQSWTVNEFTNYIVKITSGTGSGQWRKVTSNTADTLTVGTWDTTPDGTSVYEVSKSSRLVATETGVYRVNAHISFMNGIAGSAFGIAILQNGSFKSVMFLGDNTSTEFTFSDNRLLELNSGDYVEFVGWNGNGSVLGMNAGNFRTFLDFNRVD